MEAAVSPKNKFKIPFESISLSRSYNQWSNKWKPIFILVSINTLKAEEIKLEYSPPTIDEEKIVESLKDKNRSKLYKIFKSGCKN